MNKKLFYGKSFEVQNKHIISPIGDGVNVSDGSKLNS
ncbi:hypothetical protein QFZ20_002656 [Flavobacterium sp. W4I14]|nr:hypothetical protein [Flavobacterium sp. W4I14]